MCARTGKLKTPTDDVCTPSQIALLLRSSLKLSYCRGIMRRWRLLTTVPLVLTLVATYCCAFLIDGRVVHARRRNFFPQSASTSDAKEEWTVSRDGLSGTLLEQRDRPHLTSKRNATLPIALMVLAPDVFPTRSKAMRAIR